MRVRSNFLKEVIKKFIPKDFLLWDAPNKNDNVSLTFDDGPHPQYTQPILKMLRKAGVKATFFLSGTETEKYPQLVREIINNGHEIGNHNFSHRHIKRMGYKELSQEIQQTNRIIHDIAGISPRFFRPPYGELNLQVLRCMFTKKMVAVLWSVDSQDSLYESPFRLRDQLKIVQSGDIILLHTDYPHTAEALPGIIDDIKEKGLNFVSVSELMRIR